jgi:VanZ family protein
MRLSGQTFGMGLILVIFAVYIGAVQFTPQNYPELLSSIRVTFTISVILSVIAVFASLARNKNDENRFVYKGKKIKCENHN